MIGKRGWGGGGRTVWFSLLPWHSTAFHESHTRELTARGAHDPQPLLMVLVPSQVMFALQVRVADCQSKHVESGPSPHSDHSLQGVQLPTEQ